ncbi:hydroxyacylglutathione hydrolase [Alkalibacterium sp.]|nr:MAG: hydroxyacylglutathione hydrolase [Alkalibacterium sp.]
MKINPVKALSDNYIWVIEEGEDAVVVDPGESDGVLSYLEERQLKLNAILLTHKHHDHVDGLEGVLEKYPNMPVYGPVETQSLVTQVMKDGDQFTLLGRDVEVAKTAGHSEEHISYLMDEHLLCGDALFSAGCGRVFTKDYQAQFDALAYFNSLDSQVKVYAGHEYTETNLRFAKSVDPSNVDIKRALEEVEELREKDKPTLPSTIEREKRINLFLQAETLEAFKKLRDNRDQF